MDWIQLVGGLAGVATIVSTIIMVASYRRRSKTGPRKRTSAGIPLWDAVINRSRENGESVVIARLTASGQTSSEAGHRAAYLLREWNQMRLGFEFPLEGPKPMDDEDKPIVIVREDLLPDSHGSEVSVTVEVKRRVSILESLLERFGPRRR